MYRDEDPIEDAEIVEDVEAIDEAEMVADADIVDDAYVVTADDASDPHAMYWEEPQPPAEEVPAGLGRAMGCMCGLVGAICVALGYGYTINHVPAPWFGVPVILLGIYLFLFPRSSMMRKMHENMKRQ